MYTVSDLFCGCGGFSLGFKNAGFRINQAFDIDEFACATYKTNFGIEPVCKDISKVSDNQFSKVDVLIGGFPCQPFSLSGLQDGFSGKSGDGFEQCVRVIKLCKPKVLILENVTGFKNLHKGLFLKLAIRQLEALGYYLKTFVLDSSNYNVPQHRKRLFIVGNNISSEIIPPLGSNQKISVKSAIGDLIGKESKLKNHEPMKHTQNIIKRFAATLPGETTRDAMDRDPSLGNANISKQCYRRLIADEPAPTLVANFVTTTIHYSENRNITAREGARIQSFPDEFVFEGLKTRMSWQSGLSQFEQIGNAVPPLVAENLAKMVKKIFKKEYGYAPKNQSHNMELFDDLDKQYEEFLKKKKIKNNNSGRRGRTSKFQDFYALVEKLAVGEKSKLPDGILEHKMFLDAAMRRRNILWKVTKINKVDYFEKL